MNVKIKLRKLETIETTALATCDCGCPDGYDEKLIKIWLATDD